MLDKRKQTRRLARGKIELIDTNTGAPLGTLANMTIEGMMLISREPIMPDTVFQLEMHLPRPYEGRDILQLGAETLWCMRSGDLSGYYWSGFRIIDMDEETEALVERMIADWHPARRTAA